jgi:mono/diheme cytochrome c family protein
MIAAVIFVLAFLVLGLSVLFFAFSGRGGARTRRGAPSRAGRRFVAVMVTIVIIALGVAVPLAIGVVNGNDHAKNAPGGVDLNAAQTSGRAVFGKYCSTCHTLKASNAVGKVGPNLDVLHPPKGLILNAIAKGRARGQGQMPAGLVDGQDAQDVAAYVAAVAGRG